MPTMGFDKDKIKRRQYQVNLIGLGGSASIRGYWVHYYDEVHAVIYVIDCSDAARLNESVALLRETLSSELLKGKPVLM